MMSTGVEPGSKNSKQQAVHQEHEIGRTPLFFQGGCQLSTPLNKKWGFCLPSFWCFCCRCCGCWWFAVARKTHIFLLLLLLLLSSSFLKNRGLSVCRFVGGKHRRSKIHGEFSKLLRNPPQYLAIGANPPQYLSIGVHQEHETGRTPLFFQGSCQLSVSCQTP